MSAFEWWHLAIVLGVVAASAFVWGFASVIGRAAGRLMLHRRER